MLDELVGSKPEMGHMRYRLVDELMQRGLQHLPDAIEILERTAVSQAKQAALDEISTTLEPTDPA